MPETTADAVDRETAWLNTTGDGLPELVKTDSGGGPFDVVQAYYPRTPNMNQRAVYVLRSRIRQIRYSNGRLHNQYPLRLVLQWPLLAVNGSAEDEQRAFDAAVDLVLQRVAGPLLDKTHGGRFMQAAEDPREVGVEFHDPLETIPRLGALLAEVTYQATDEIVG